MRSEKFRSQEGILSEREREIVASVEKFPVSDEGRVDLVLTWRGLKPATDIHLLLRKWYRTDREDLSPVEEKLLVESTKTLFGSIGLKVVEGRKKHDEIYSAEEEDKNTLVGDAEYQTIFVACREEDVNKLAVEYYKNERENCGAIGRLFGFPETAVKAYERVASLAWNEKGERVPVDWGEISKGVLVGSEDLPPDAKKQDFVAFAEFALSAEHWREELDKARDWADEIRKVDPDLYARKVREYHARIGYQNPEETSGGGIIV